MKQIHKARWLTLATALRSGDYPQALAQLRTPKGYCCLGVACNLMGPEGWSLTPRGYNYDGSDVVLPHSAQEYYDTPDFGLEFNFETRENRRTSLPDLNDSNFTFAQIADIIEWRINHED